MQFSTLFLFASAVLALSNGCRFNNAGKLAKRDGGFRFPTEDEDDKNSPNYRFRPDDDNSNKDVNKDRDNNGNPCQLYAGKELVDIPEECMKPVFCKWAPTYRMSCDLELSFDQDNWTKDKLIKEVRTPLCVSEAICKDEDMEFA